MDPKSIQAFPSGIVRKSRPAHDHGADFYVTDFTEPRNAGMTLRDYFAAQAMPLAFQYWRECTNGVDGDFVFARTADEGEMDLMAADCYAMADAMLAAR